MGYSMLIQSQKKQQLQEIINLNSILKEKVPERNKFEFNSENKGSRKE